jgi:acetate---CoA ligase (ADP-forming)
MGPVMDALLRPRSVAVIGASAQRVNNGTVVLENLRRVRFGGEVIPVHGSAAEIAGYRAVPRIAALPVGIDVAIVSVPAEGVAAVIRELDAAQVRSAIVMSNGFSAEDEAELRAVASEARIAMHGPNCMGLINMTDAIPLYTATVPADLRQGSIAVLAQSGSAAIALMTAIDTGISKVVTMGSEFRISPAEYMRWLASDDATRAIGLVMESVTDPDGFADAVAEVHAAGKAVVVLKIGQSQAGALATQAHTGALIRNSDAVQAFFARHGVPTVHDYDELAGALECAALSRRRARGPRLGILGISGGEVALICDLAEAEKVPLAQFAPETREALYRDLSGSIGRNPIDLGQTVAKVRFSHDRPGLRCIRDDTNVDILFVILDAHASLDERSLLRHRALCEAVVETARESDKPVMMASSTSEPLHRELRALLHEHGIPMLRGLRVALAAARSLALLGTRRDDPRRGTARPLRGGRAELHAKLRDLRGPVPAETALALLAAYGIERARSAVFADAAAALDGADAIGYPLVVKIASPDIAHRSDIGGVMLGIRDRAALQSALATIADNVARHAPSARIEGFELQEELTGCVEAMCGFSSAPPFGMLAVIGTGGTMVELQADTAVGLCPLTPLETEAMLGRTRLGALLGGYRNLVPVTDTSGLRNLLLALSELAADMQDVLTECDLNPVLARPGSGAVRVVDVLFIAGHAA